MIANHKGEIPFLILLLPYLLGITLGITIASAASLPVLAGIFLGLASLFIFLNTFYKRLAIYKTRWIGGILLNLILLTAGWYSAITCNEINNKDHFSGSAAQLLLVKINSEPQLKNGMVKFTASVEQAVLYRKAKKVSGTLLITIKDSAATNLQYGDVISIFSNYKPVEPPFTPGSFNYKNYLAHQNIYFQAFLYPGAYRVIKHDTGNPLIAYALKLRRQMVAKFKQQLHNPDAIAVASTLILGYKADLSDDVLKAYSKTGTIHVLSVSGAHVAILYFLLQLILGFLNTYRYGKQLKAYLIILIILYYAMLSGFSPAVCRAAVMSSMVIIGKTFARHINMLNILALSAFLLLLYNPLFLTDVGFQLSYLAVAGLIILQPVVYKWIQFKNKWADKLWAICSVSIAAQVITFPLSALYFHQFPVYFLLSNLLIIIPTSVIMYSGLAYLMLSWVPLLSGILAFVLENIILLMNKALVLIENAPFACINKLWLSTAEFLLLYTVIICLFYFLYAKKSWLLKLCLGCTILICISVSIKKYRAANTSSVAFLNLRKNIGIVLKSGNSAVVLTNLTDTDKSYRYAVQPYLDSCQINTTFIVEPDKELSLPYLHKLGCFIQFYDKKIVVLNKQMQAMQLPQKLKTDYLYVTGNTHTSLQQLNKNYGYGQLVIDGSNNDDVISNLENEAKQLHINYKILKRNFSLIAQSN